MKEDVLTPSNPEGGPRGAVRQASFAHTLFTYAICVLVAVVLAAVVRYVLIEPYRIPTGSMLPTIQLNDMVLANKLVYKVGGKPKRGDIVVFKDPTGEYPQLIKRVVAIGGQTVELRSGSVYIDGQKLDEPYTKGKPSEPLAGVQVTFPYQIPAKEIWVMGDNRTNSADSRFFGAVPVKNVYGRAWWTYWPLSHFGALR
jgi:signal peptidase I